MYLNSIYSFIPSQTESNFDVKKKFNIDNEFLNNKLGILNRSKLQGHLKASDMCFEAYKKFIKKNNKTNIDCLIVVTQNPDYQIPHTSAILQNKLDLNTDIACFDLSLGCSGYIYGLSIMQDFLKNNNLKNGFLFTADPYSKIIDDNDKNTKLIFSDAATLSFFNNNLDGSYFLKYCAYETYGEHFDKLILKNGKLHMNGTSILNFTIRSLPKFIKSFLLKNKIDNKDIDGFVFHQASKYILDFIQKKCNIPNEKMLNNINEVGNTVSSSIPLILRQHLESKKKFILVGFGVGLSASIGYIVPSNE